ncbi:hypothetical protein Tco_1404485 [Tanacetum coccineum]
MDTKKVSDRFVAPCLVNGFEAYDGEINLRVEENMISNEYAVKLCLEHEVKRGNKVVKKELIVALRGEIYFMKFIINPEEDDVEPGVIFRRSFLWESNNNNKRATENLNLFYQDIGTSSSTERHLTQEEAAKEALAVRISQKFALLEEVIKHEVARIRTSSSTERHLTQEEAAKEAFALRINQKWNDCDRRGRSNKKVKGEALKEKDDPGALIFLIRLEGQVNENALADTGSDINTMPYWIYETLKELMKMEYLHDDGDVKVTTLIAKFSLILDIPIDRDAPIVVGRGFLHTAARSDVMRNEKSDSDDEEEYEIKRIKFGPKPAPYLNCNDPAERSLWEETMLKPDHLEPNALDNMKQWNRMYLMGCDGEIDDMLRIKLREVESNRLDITTLRELIDSEGRLIPVDPQPGMPRVGIPRPLRASMQDLYDRMGSMKIRHEAIESMEYRQSYH